MWIANNVSERRTQCTVFWQHRAKDDGIKLREFRCTDSYCFIISIAKQIEFHVYGKKWNTIRHRRHCTAWEICVGGIDYINMSHRSVSTVHKYSFVRQPTFDSVQISRTEGDTPCTQRCMSFHAATTAVRTTDSAFYRCACVCLSVCITVAGGASSVVCANALLCYLSLSLAFSTLF